MKTLHDDDLILYYYGEAQDPETIRRRLEQSAELRARYEALRRTLEEAREGFPVPQRTDSYGAEVWKRLEPRLADKAPSPSTPLPSPTLPVPGRGENLRKGWKGDGRGAGGEGRAAEPPRFRRLAALAAAAVVLLTAGFLAGRFWPQPGRPRLAASAAETAFPAAARDRILVRSVAAHLERSERLFTEVANAEAPGPVDVSAERRWARDLLAANRLYRQSTLRSGHPRLTSLLGEIEPFLLELSHGPDEISADDLTELRQRCDEQALLFKMRVVSERLAGPKTL